MAFEQSTMGVWDYVVCGIVVTTTFAIAIYYGITRRKKGSVSDYLFAEKSMSFLPVTLSIQASFESAILVLGMPAEGYAYGISYAMMEMSTSIGRAFEQILLLNYIWKIDLVSPFKYLDLRFKSRCLRLVATAMCCLENLFYMSIVLYGQASAIQAVTGFSIIGSITVTTLGTVIYTSLGGLRVVIWTDVLQIVFMFTGVLVVTIMGTELSGGISEVLRRSTLTGRFDLDFHTDITLRGGMWNVLAGGMFLGMGFVFRPAVLQRVRASKSLPHARRAIFLALITFPIAFYLATFQGMVAYSYFTEDKCDPIASKQLDSINQIIPYMILKIFTNYPGLSGVFIAGLFSASISTMSSCLSAMASITLEDFILPFFPGLSEFKGVMISRLSVVAYGVLSCGLAIVITTMGQTAITQMFFIMTTGTRSPLAALFYLGLLFPFVNKKSAVMGVLVGASLVYWIVLGSKLSPGVYKTSYLEPAPVDHCFIGDNSSAIFNATIQVQTDIVTGKREMSGLDTLYSMAYPLYALVGTVATMTVALICAAITGGNKDNLDPAHVLPIARTLDRYMPERLRTFSSKQYPGIYDQAEEEGILKKKEDIHDAQPDVETSKM